MSAATWGEHPPGRSSTCPICTPEPHWHGRPVHTHRQYEVLTMGVPVKCFNETVPAVKLDCSPLLCQVWLRKGAAGSSTLRLTLGGWWGFFTVQWRDWSLGVSWGSLEGGQAPLPSYSSLFPLSSPCVHPAWTDQKITIAVCASGCIQWQWELGDNSNCRNHKPVWAPRGVKLSRANLHQRAAGSSYRAGEGVWSFPLMQGTWTAIDSASPLVCKVSLQEWQS